MSSLLNRPPVDIASLVPHAGSMVLLDQVVDFDAQTIHCRACLNPAGHPLAIAGVVPGAALAEYGAQAMAVHGALLDGSESMPRPGRLVALGQLDLAVDELPGRTTLEVHASRIGGDQAGQMYNFEVLDGERCLVRGQATVMFANQQRGA